MNTRCNLRKYDDTRRLIVDLSHTVRSLATARLTGALLCAVVLAGAAACSDADKRRWQHRTPGQNFSTALESGNGDLRREAVVRIAESNYWASDDAFHVLDAVARTDPVSQVRCIAIRVLARYDDNRPVQPLLSVLSASGPGGEALPGDDDVRWETARALAGMQHKGLLDADQQRAACELFIGLLRNDRSRNVRIVSTKALGSFKDERVLNPLINALRNQDFMIADSAERSLIALTGQSHDYDAEAWTRWLEQTPEPFAKSTPSPSTRPASWLWPWGTGD